MKIFTIILATVALAFSACTTTKDATGNTTTSLTPTGDAAVTAAIQIASAAATAAIQAYIASPGAVPHARLHLSMQIPALVAAAHATETEVRKSEPSLPSSQVHKITFDAFTKALSSTQ